MENHGRYSYNREPEPGKKPKTQPSQYRSRANSEVEMKEYFDVNVDRQHRVATESAVGKSFNTWQPIANPKAAMYSPQTRHRPVNAQQCSQACRKGVVNILSPSITRHTPVVAMQATLAYEPDQFCMQVENYQAPCINVQKPVIYRRRLCRLSHALDISPVVYSGERIIIPTKYKGMEQGSRNHFSSIKSNRMTETGSSKAMELENNRATPDDKAVVTESDRAIQIESDKAVRVQNREVIEANNEKAIRTETHRKVGTESEQDMVIEETRAMEIERNRRRSRIGSIVATMALPTVIQPVVMAKPCLTRSKEDAACEAIITGEGKLFSERPRSKTRYIGTRKESEAYNERRQSAQPTVCTGYNSVPQVDAGANTDFHEIPIMQSDRCYRVSVSAESKPNPGKVTVPAANSSATQIATKSTEKLVIASRSSADLVVTPARSSADQLVSAHGSSIQRTTLQKPSKGSAIAKQSKTKIKLTQCPVKKCHIATQCRGGDAGGVDRNQQTVTECPSLYRNGKYILESANMVSGDSAKNNSLKDGTEEKKISARCQYQQTALGDFQNCDTTMENTQREKVTTRVIQEQNLSSKSCHQARSMECQSNKNELVKELERSSECNIKLNAGATPRVVKNARQTKSNQTALKPADNDLASKIRLALKLGETTQGERGEHKMAIPSAESCDCQNQSTDPLQTDEESSRESTMKENKTKQDAQTETSLEMNCGRSSHRHGQSVTDTSSPTRTSPWQVPRNMSRSKSSAAPLTRSRTPPRSSPRHARSCSRTPPSTMNNKAGAGATDVAAQMTITMESYCSDAIMRRAMTASFAAVQYRKSVRHSTTIRTTGLNIPVGLRRRYR